MYARRSRRSIEIAALALVTVASVLFFFRFDVASGFAVMIGDRYDGIIEASLVHHWYQVFTGVEPWNRPAYFHPYPDTLGYNDGYFLYGLIYAPIRAMGVEPMMAAECVHMAVKAFGAVGMYGLVGRLLPGRTGWALYAAALFTIANNSFVQSVHAQLLSVAFTPFAAWLLLRLIDVLRSESRRAVFARASVLLLFLSAWLMTAYYTAWFFAFFTAATAVAAVCIAPRRRLGVAARTARRHALPLAAALLLFGLSLIPFLSVYLPKAHETGMHLWTNAKSYAVPPAHIIDVGSGNWLWGAAIEALYRHLPPPPNPTHELIAGFPPLLLITAFVAMIALSRRDGGRFRPALLAMAIALIVTELLALRFGKASGWKAVFHLMPGAKGMRVIARYQLFLMLPLTIFVVLLFARATGRRGRIAAMAAAGILLLEQGNATSPAMVDRQAAVAMLRAVPPIPAHCRSFYVIRARATPYPTREYDDLRYPHNIDAMLIAETRGVPTIGGYASFNPPDWAATDPATPGYAERMRATARRHGVHSVCALDVTSPTPWRLDVE